MAKSTAKPSGVPVVLEPEVLDAVVETQLARTTAVDIEGFLAGVSRFFNKAAQLERAARLTLADVKQFPPPATVEEDLAIQQVILKANADKKIAEEHWKVTAIFHQVHKRLVAGRNRTTDVLDEIATIGNAHHNRYAEAERRRAAEEQERLRREAEARAAQERQIELARLEEAALKAEADAPDLSPRERRFLELYLSRPIDAPRHAALAGYKGVGAAERLLALPKMQAAIEAARTAETARKQAAAIQATPVEVVHEAVKPQVAKVAGHGGRTYWSAEIVDAEAFVAAAVAGKHGIPLDALYPNLVKLNDYANSLHERIDLWPGVRHVRKDKLV